ncbi:MAG TPA: glycosyltransferase family 4 protein [Chloroflexia bacterium]|jgi:glycosyltransferase involved in cell wall biosynthesis|nr:glycosyltransferase family 4 protein [Chloroflexia bacterium]
MRILFVSDLYPPIWVGGYELNCAEMAEGLRARGHHVEVLTSAYRAEQVHAPETGVYRLLQFKSNLRRPKTADMTGVGRNRITVQLHNVRIIRRIIAQVRPDVLVFWGGHELGRGLLSAAEQRCRVVYFLADNWLTLELGIDQRPWRYRASRRLYDLALRVLGIPSGAVRRDHLIFVSRALQNQYAGLGIDVRKGTVIHLGIAEEFARFQPQHILRRTPDEPPRVLYTGQLVAAKGVLTLIKALAQLRTRPGLEQTRLTLAGGVHHETFGAALRAEIHALGLDDAVEFAGRLPRAELPALFSRHDVQAFTSEWQEPFALSLLEGMASGIPVVSTLRGGSAEVIRDGANARAFAAGDPADLADKLAWVLSHPQEAAALGRTASAEIRQCCTLRSELDALEAYLQNMVAGGPPDAPAAARTEEHGAPRERAGTGAG